MESNGENDIREKVNTWAFVTFFVNPDTSTRGL